jgi:hypothetical protein
MVAQHHAQHRSQIKGEEPMSKTFEAIYKLKDIEIELHRLKNALEMANRSLEAKYEKSTWTRLTEDEIMHTWESVPKYVLSELRVKEFARAIEAALKEKNT